MEKQQILDQLIQSVKKEIKSIEQAATMAKNVATSDETKSESKWDTRAIEAGYLAGAQEARVNELKLELQLLQETQIKHLSQDDEIVIGALVELEHNNNARMYFLTPTAGGTLLNIDNNPIMVVSVFSPIGKEMLGLNVGDTFELTTPKEKREYSILSIC
jgi:transcription elongation GreA/GreB family factor